MGRTHGDLSRRFALLTTEALESGRDAERRASRRRTLRGIRRAKPFTSSPAFPFVAGASYSLVARPSSSQRVRITAPAIVHIRRPANEAEPTAFVSGIYPDVAAVPVNLLKFYVQFSEPMSEGRAQRAIRVCRDDTGQPLEGVFVPMDPELWDPARQRMTLLLDPARIKHGLVPNMEAGYPLIEGVPIRLFIDPSFRDSKGQRLRAGAERRYEVGPEVRRRIDPRQWRLTVPAPGSVELIGGGV